jgi:hypothetical protein
MRSLTCSIIEPSLSCARNPIRGSSRICITSEPLVFCSTALPRSPQVLMALDGRNGCLLAKYVMITLGAHMLGPCGLACTPKALAREPTRDCGDPLNVFAVPLSLT